MVHGLYPCHMFGVNLKYKSETENLKENGPTLGTCQEQMIILFEGMQLSSRPQRISVDNIISKMSNSQSKTHKSEWRKGQQKRWRAESKPQRLHKLEFSDNIA